MKNLTFKYLIFSLCTLLLTSSQVQATYHLVDLAVPIQPDDILSETLEAGDNFYFLVVIPESGVLRTYTQSTIDTYGELILTDATEIAVADNGAVDGNFLIEAMVSPGEYLIRVAGATTDGVQMIFNGIAYRINITE